MLKNKNFINGFIKKINLMPNSKEKAIYISLLISYLDFYLSSKQITEDERTNYLYQINELNCFFKYYIHDEQKSAIDIYNSCGKLTELYQSILNYANNYNLFTIIPAANISTKTILSCAEEFMYFMDKDVLKLYYKLLDKKLVCETDIGDNGGLCFKIDGNTSAILIDLYNVPLHKMFSIVHEMGHAYYHYLNKGIPSLSRTNIAREVLPKIFEQLFLDYLRENRLIDKNNLDIYERFSIMHQLKLTNSVYIVNKLLLNNAINAYLKPEDVKVKLSHEDYYNLSIIKPKNDDEQKYLSYDYNYYAYAFLVSSLIKERFKKNELETRKFIKEYPIYAQELTSKELIDLFDKSEYINSVNKNTSRVLSKTHYKK